MAYYIIVEKEDGFSVATVNEGKTAESVAKDANAVLIDEGPYASYSEAEDVLLTLPNPYESNRPQQ